MYQIKTDGMQINCVTIISVFGRIDQLSGEQLEEHLKSQVLQGNIKLVLDFKNVDFTNSEGLRLLLASLKQVRSSGGDILLANTSSLVQDILKTTGFSNLLKNFTDIDSAIMSFQIEKK